ncbi:hypothetical protein [Streptomyces scabiei]|uniref:hypothetical protein n=1 Tax=Streptomyces scabiei TaxID=1930 RepID=UPI0029A7057B|nr:hypothetical protein [Streptomyces scabiei]MDX3205097.1 hypothetical protein [Streptomyces scabiei]
MTQQATAKPGEQQAPTPGSTGNQGLGAASMPRRLTQLLDTMRAHGGRWTTARVKAVRGSAAPGRRTARRDLQTLHRRGFLTMHEADGIRSYILSRALTPSAQQDPDWVNALLGAADAIEVLPPDTELDPGRANAVKLLRRMAVEGLEHYPPALVWARYLDADDLEAFLGELSAEAAGADDLATLAAVENTIATWRFIGEAQHAHNTAAGPGSSEAAA